MPQELFIQLTMFLLLFSSRYLLNLDYDFISILLIFIDLQLSLTTKDSRNDTNRCIHAVVTLRSVNLDTFCVYTSITTVAYSNYITGIKSVVSVTIFQHSSLCHPLFNLKNKDY